MNSKGWTKEDQKRKAQKRKWKQENLLNSLDKKQMLDQKTEETVTIPKEEIVQEVSTISMAIPGSILENTQSDELSSYLAGQIARAACIFQLDEIVIFDDYCDEVNSKKSTIQDSYDVKTVRRSCVILARRLQFLECPQYLRKSFFPIHNDLRNSGLMHPLNAPHHLGRDDHFKYREGVVLDKPVKQGHGSMVNVGLNKEVHVDKLLQPGIRCTVKLSEINKKKVKGVVVSSSTPRCDTGVYWGYKVRLANSLSTVFSQSPYKDGYDVTIGTSDKGSTVDDFTCQPYKHLLIMFGGVNGIEFALENDSAFDIDDPQLLFDHYLNTLPDQGSKTIRTEEAVLVSLSALRSKLNPEKKPKMFDVSSITKLEKVAKTLSPKPEKINLSSSRDNSNMDRFN